MRGEEKVLSVISHLFSGGKNTVTVKDGSRSAMKPMVAMLDGSPHCKGNYVQISFK